MCKCTPNKRTPFCGVGDCKWPEPYPKCLHGLNERDEAAKISTSYADSCIEHDKLFKKILSELFLRWDGLGPDKDDDFGKVSEKMEELREFINRHSDVPELSRRLKKAIAIITNCGEDQYYINFVVKQLETNKIIPNYFKI